MLSSPPEPFMALVSPNHWHAKNLKKKRCRERWDARGWVLTLSLEPSVSFYGVCLKKPKCLEWKRKIILSNSLFSPQNIPWFKTIQEIWERRLDGWMDRCWSHFSQDAMPWTPLAPSKIIDDRRCCSREALKRILLLVSETRKVWETTQVKRNNYLIISLGKFLCSEHCKNN